MPGERHGVANHMTFNTRFIQQPSQDNIKEIAMLPITGPLLGEYTAVSWLWLLSFHYLQVWQDFLYQ